MPWKCSCGAINSAVNSHCALSKQKDLQDIEHIQVSPTTFDMMLMLKANKEFEAMTDNEEKFSKFYNSEMVLFASMTPLEQIEHIQELEDIAFEAKARLTAAKTHQRDSRAKAQSKHWTVTETAPDQTVSDAINRVKLRTSRMSRLDKTRQSLIDTLGISDAEADKMIDKMRVQARKDLKSDNNDDNAAGVTVTNPVKPKPLSPAKDSKPLDLSTLKFGE